MPAMMKCIRESYVDKYSKAAKSKSTFYDAIDPNLVYSNNILGKLEEGVSFTISGNILFHCERFSINLVVENTHRDIALHINPRLPQNYIVRNCRVKKLWGQEEVTSALPFILRRGSVFRIQILITNTEYLISVNGNHFAAFEHRLPYTNVTCLEVKGDVDNVTMERTEVSSYPQRTSETEPNVIKQVVRTEEPLRVRKSSFFERDHSSTTEELPLPFYGSFDNSFTNGSTLVVHGQVKLLPHSFYINLQKGKDIWPHPLIAFHFNPRFSNFGGKHVICRNSWIKDKWDKEERSEMKTEFLPGNTFSMSISCTYTAYEVYLNNIFIAEFKFRTDPTMVDTVYIQGDIKLRSITVDNQHNKQQNVD